MEGLKVSTRGSKKHETASAWPRSHGDTDLWSLILPEWSNGNPEPMDFIKAIRAGLPGSTVIKASDILQIPKSDLYLLLHMAPRTAQRMAKSAKLDVDKSDHLIQVLKVYNRSVDLFNDRDKAMRWLKSPNFALGDLVPLSLLDTSEGIEMVTDTLTRIQHGVFA